MFSGFRYRRGLSQAAFATLAGLPLQLIKEWEAHKRPASLSALRDLATGFHVSVSDLPHKPPKDVSLCYGSSALWLGPEPVSWTGEAQAQWGASPFDHWGYLRLQLTSDEGPRWYLVSGEQAWWFQNEIDRRSGAEMIVGKTLNNRVLMFALDRVFDASLLSKARSVSRPDFLVAWDGDGLSPEVYRLLRNWARNDTSEYFGSSRALHEQREALLGRPGMRRRTTIAALVPCSTAGKSLPDRERHSVSHF